MKVIVFLALFAFAYGEYPAATPEIVEPSDSYGPPPEVPAAVYSAPAAPSDSYGAPAPAPAPAPAAPSDSYGPPAKAVTVKAPAPITTTVAAPEVLTAAAPEPAVIETVAAAPVQSASFNFLSELTPALSLPSPAPETFAVPVAPQFQTTLVPPSISLPQVQYVQPVQTYAAAPVRIALQAVAAPPVTIPPVNLPPINTPIPLPPVSLPPLPVQPLPLETKTTTTQVTALPSTYYAPQYVLSAPAPAPAPLTYAPSFSNFFKASSIPTTFYSAPKITSLPEITSFKPAPVTTVKAAPAPRIPATSYGTPSFERKK